MAKALRVVGTVAAVVAIVAAPFSPAVAAIASAVAAVANAGAMTLQKRPGAIGAINQVVIGANMPVPYAVGRTYVAGNQVYDNSGGSTNRYRFNVNVLTAAGPIDSYEKILADFATQGFITDPEQGGSHMKATGFYSDFMWHKRQLGNRPEATALVDGNTPMPQWGSANKLSGYAAMLFVMKFDKDAKRYTGGVPQLGAVGKWVKIYDPRKDSTYPGGSGGHRWNDESTWEWSENPALHALTYARGRFIEKTAAGAPLVPPVKLLGCGFPFEAIDVAAFVEGANLCEANGWTCGGIVYEAPGTNKWENLKRFCQSFAAQPALAGGRLGLKLFAPRPSLFTLTADDLADGGIELRAMKPFQERRNSIVPRFRSEGHRWDYVQGDAVTISTYVADDGELRSEEVQYDLCQDKDQAAELAAADLIMGRQFGPLNVTVKPWMMRYRPGEAGDVNLPELGLNDRRMVIVARKVDPTGAVTFTMESEPTLEEYAFALGRTGTAPPTPVIRAPGEIDEAIDTGGLRNTGEWASGTLYLKGDLFQFDGSSYIVDIEHTSSGTSPDLTKVTVLAAKGEPGIGGGTESSGAFIMTGSNTTVAPETPIAVTAGTLVFNGTIDSDNSASGGTTTLSLVDETGAILATVASATSLAGGLGGSAISFSYPTGLAAGVWKSWKLRLTVSRAGSSGTAAGTADGTYHQ